MKYILFVGALLASGAAELLSKQLDPLADGISSLELIRVSGSDLDVVNAARVSYGKISNDFTEKDANLVRYMLMHEHMSPFEHNQLSFRVKAPMFVARQWFRHRLNSFNEVSYRYVQAPEEFYVPKMFRWQDKKSKQSSYGSFEDKALRDEYIAAITQSRLVYEKLVAADVCREQARGVLPVCVYTEFIFTCNLRSLMHFLQLRLDTHAQWEIQVFAAGMLELAREHFPVSLAAFSEKNKLNW